MYDLYDAGYAAYWNGGAYDPNQQTAWRNGWLDAEFEDNGDYGDEYEFDEDFYYDYSH